MDKAVSATDANRAFSRLLHGVCQGHSYVVTSHGQPIARLSPVNEPDGTLADARRALLGYLRRQRLSKGSPWTRDELYERER